MQLELLLVPVAVAASTLWLARLNHHPRWLLVLGSAGLMGVLALIPGWLQPVGSPYGTGACGSVLRPEQANADTNGDCEWIRAEQYNSTIPYFVGAMVVLTAAGGVSAVRWRKSGSNPNSEEMPKGPSGTPAL